MVHSNIWNATILLFNIWHTEMKNSGFGIITLPSPSDLVLECVLSNWSVITMYFHVQKTLKIFSITLLLWELFPWGLQTQIANYETQMPTVCLLKHALLAPLGEIWTDDQIKQETNVHRSNKFVNITLLVSIINLLTCFNRREHYIGVIKPEWMREDQRVLIYVKGKCSEKYERGVKSPEF